jgi:hypothetical protein
MPKRNVKIETPESSEAVKTNEFETAVTETKRVEKEKKSKVVEKFLKLAKKAGVADKISSIEEKKIKYQGNLVDTVFVKFSPDNTACMKEIIWTMACSNTDEFPDELCHPVGVFEKYPEDEWSLCFYTTINE